MPDPTRTPIALAAILLAAPVHAETTHCSLIEDRTDRHACHALSQAPPSRDWLVTGSKASNSTAAIKTADRPVMCAGEISTLTLGILCKADRTSLYLSTGCVLGETGTRTTVTVQRDDQTPTAHAFTVATRRQVIGLDEDADALGFVTSLLDHAQIDVTVTPPSHPPFTASVSVAGLGETLQPLRTACGW